MSAAQLLPLASYAKEILPGVPVLAIDEDFPVTVRITMAAIDPSEGESDEPSTLRILKRPIDFPEDGIAFSDDEDEDDEEDEEDDDEEMEEAPKPKSKKAAKAAAEEEDEDEEDEEDEDDEDEDDEDEEDFEIEQFAVCTLGPKVAFQQTLDLVINPSEEVLFEVTGSFPVYVTGNYVEHPYDEDSDDFDSEDEDDFDSDDYDQLDAIDSDDDVDLTPDEDELLSTGRLEEVEDDEDEEEEVEQKPKKKDNKKRAAAEEAEPKGKKQKKADDKKVAFSKELEQGPTGSGAKKSKKLEGGVTVEDKTVGEGPTAKRGDKVGVRYIGKLANGKVFDSNTKGKPFYFSLGKGEVIKGWDVGVVGMALKGERRIVIPAHMAYGKQALPDIPANSELTFDVKLVNIK